MLLNHKQAIEYLVEAATTLTFASNSLRAHGCFTDEGMPLQLYVAPHPSITRVVALENVVRACVRSASVPNVTVKTAGWRESRALAYWLAQHMGQGTNTAATDAAWSGDSDKAPVTVAAAPPSMC